MEIDGQVTISLKTFNQLQDRAKQADELKKKNAGSTRGDHRHY